MKKKVTDNERKEIMFTIRLNADQDDYIEATAKIIQAKRGPGARKVSKTEAALILLTLGMEEFNRQNKQLAS